MNIRQINTGTGCFCQDNSGLWHYKNNTVPLTVDEAAEDAISYRPLGAAWFWFNGTPAPILITDNKEELVVRWGEWRSMYQADGKNLLSLMQSLAPGSN